MRLKTADVSHSQQSILEKLDVPSDTKSAKAVLKHIPSAPDENSPDNPSRASVLILSLGYACVSKLE